MHFLQIFYNLLDRRWSCWSASYLTMVEYCKGHQTLESFMYEQMSQKQVLWNTGLASFRCCFIRCCFAARRFFAVISNQQSYGALSLTWFCRCSPYFTENGNQTWRFGSGQLQFGIIQVASFKFWKSPLWINEISHSYKVLIMIHWSIKWKAAIFFKECQTNNCCIGPKGSGMLPF